MLTVVITGPAKRDMEDARDWWAENRTAEQAASWYLAAFATMELLATFSGRYPLARERSLQKRDIRQVAFGLGRRPTHRILYAVRGERVVVYRVRSGWQDDLTDAELEL